MRRLGNLGLLRWLKLFRRLLCMFWGRRSWLALGMLLRLLRLKRLLRLVRVGSRLGYRSLVALLCNRRLCPLLRNRWLLLLVLVLLPMLMLMLLLLLLWLLLLLLNLNLSLLLRPLMTWLLLLRLLLMLLWLLLLLLNLYLRLLLLNDYIR